MLPRLNVDATVAALLAIVTAVVAGCYDPPETVDLGYELNIKTASLEPGPCPGGTAENGYCHEIHVDFANEDEDRKTNTTSGRWDAGYNVAGDSPAPWYPPTRVEGPSEVSPRGTADFVLLFETDEDKPLEILRYQADWGDGPGVFFVPQYS